MFQQLIIGLSIGSVYALMAVGYSLIYSLLNFTNFAHGAVVMAGAYAGYYCLALISPSMGVALLGAVLVGALLSFIYERLAYRPLRLKGARRLYMIIAGLGIATFFENLVIVQLGARFKAYPQLDATRSVTVLGAQVATIDIQILIFSLVALALFQLWLTRSRHGLAIRAAAHRLDTTALMGVNVDRLIGVVFLLAGALGGLAGAFLGAKYTAYPQLGYMTLKAFISAVLGGLGSLPGAVLGSFVLGVLETFVAAYLSSTLRDVFAFALLAALLILRPSGLLGKAAEEKA